MSTAGRARHYAQGLFPREARFLLNTPLPCRQAVLALSRLTCTVIRLCGVWLGPGLSSQKFSVTWNSGAGPRPWKYLARSERKGQELEEREDRGSQAGRDWGGSHNGERGVAVGPLRDQGQSRSLGVVRLLPGARGNARN